MTVSKFKVGDRVYAPFHDCGVVTKITNDDTYPIEVKWEVSRYKFGDDISTFTPDGFLFYGDKRDWTRITQVGKALEGGSKFHVGDRVSFPHHGLGMVIADHNDGRLYPIDVKWDKSPEGNEVSTFTKDGFLLASLGDCGDNDKLTVVGHTLPKEEPTKEQKTESVTFGAWLNGARNYALAQVERRKQIKKSKVGNSDAVNPMHYQVAGIPEAIEIMEHLMTKEQLEGFLWGNIIKYAYRYGRKGDKKETAGKIAWYAKRLEEVLKGEHNET